MAAIKLLLGILCLTTIGSVRLFNNHLLKEESVADALKRENLVAIALREVGVRELTGNNDGVKVETYLALTGLKKGESWCASFVSYVYAKAGFSKPRSAWSPDLFPDSRCVREALPGDVLGIYFADKHRIAHVGLIIGQKGQWLSSVEGNTDVAGSREGDGVYKKLRNIKTIYRIADWVRERRTKP